MYDRYCLDKLLKLAPTARELDIGRPGCIDEILNAALPYSNNLSTLLDWACAGGHTPDNWGFEITCEASHRTGRARLGVGS
jgi:hypothetical protein